MPDTPRAILAALVRALSVILGALDDGVRVVQVEAVWGGAAGIRVTITTETGTT